MKKINTVLSLVLSALLLLGLLCPAAAAGNGEISGRSSAVKDARSAYTDIPFEVRFLQTEARKELAMVNALRTGKNAWYWNADNKTKTVLKDLKAFSYDYALERVAMQRALELVALYAHSRPNGGDCFDVYDELGYQFSAAGENIARGYEDAAGVETAWEEKDMPFEGQGHRRNILSAAYCAIGCACVEYNGVRFWAQEFSNKVNEPAATAPNNDLTVGMINFKNTQIGGWSVDPDSLRIGVGQTEDLNGITEISMTYGDRTLKTALKPVWTCDSPKIASVSENSRITGKAIGRAVLSAALPLGGSLRVDLTVQEKAVDNSKITEPIKRIGGCLYCVPDTSIYDVMTYFGTGLGFGRRFINGKWEEKIPETVYTGMSIFPPDGNEFHIVIMGDTDCDGMITASDARLALRNAVQLETFSDWQTLASLVGDSDVVTSAEARLILRGAVGLEYPLDWFRAVTPE